MVTYYQGATMQELSTSIVRLSAALCCVPDGLHHRALHHYAHVVRVQIRTQGLSAKYSTVVLFLETT